MFAINCYSMIISRPTCIIFSVFKICSFLSHPKICVYEKRVLYKYWYSWFFTSTITWVWFWIVRIWNSRISRVHCPTFQSSKSICKSQPAQYQFPTFPTNSRHIFPGLRNYCHLKEVARWSNQDFCCRVDNGIIGEEMFDRKHNYDISIHNKWH